MRACVKVYLDHLLDRIMRYQKVAKVQWIKSLTKTSLI